MTETDLKPRGGMTLGKGIVIGMLTAALGAALAVREIGMQQWELSKQYYREQVDVFEGIDALQREIRAGLAPAQAVARVEALDAQLDQPINGRTSLTLTRQKEYFDAVRRWAKGESPVREVEEAFGVLVGRLALESESLKDEPFRFATSPEPGTVPVITKKRRLI